MIVSTSLSPIPFISHTDSTRLQMSAKQLKQSLTNLNVERPYVIGDKWKSLLHNQIFRKEADKSGEVIYKNDEILIVLYDNKDLYTFNIERYKQTCYNFVSELRYCIQQGEKFKKNDILFEYDCFLNNVPSFGYNANVAYMPIFGFNFEDAVVISESFAEKSKSSKVFRETIPIYYNTIFKNMYDSELKFIPDIGQKIDGKIICQTASLNVKNKYQDGVDWEDINNILNDKGFKNIENIYYSKLENAEVIDYRLHKLSKVLPMLDKNLENNLKTKYREYLSKVKDIKREIEYNFGSMFANKTINRHYLMTSCNEFSFNNKNLVYILEIELKKVEKTTIGDKFSNR